jgi:type IX secretion system PorP/SprF family membrane protein
MKKLFGFIILLFFSANIFAQRDIMLSQQFFSRLNINPSATGNTDDVDIFLLGRWQWIGLENSPKSGVLNLTNYMESIRSGIGMTVSYDDLGVANRTLNVKAAYAYHLNLNESLLLSMGLSAGILYHYFDPAQHIWMNPEEMNNETLNYGEKLSEVHPDMDFGVELAMPKLMFGVSVSHLLSNEENVTTSLPGRQFNWYIRALFNLSEKFDLAPAFMYSNCKYMNCYEFNIAAFYKKLYWLGAGYRINANTFNAMIGAQWRMFRIGYSYDLSCGKLADFKRSTHEIMVSVNLNKRGANKDKTKTKYVRFM